MCSTQPLWPISSPGTTSGPPLTGILRSLTLSTGVSKILSECKSLSLSHQLYPSSHAYLSPPSGMDWLCPGYSSVLAHVLEMNHGNLTAQVTIRDIVPIVQTGDLHIAVYDLTGGLVRGQCKGRLGIWPCLCLRQVSIPDQYSYTITYNYHL